MLSFDEDGNDSIDFDEFVAMFECLQKENNDNPELAIRDACRILDKNSSGTLNVTELKTLLSVTGDDPLTEEQIMEMCNAVQRTAGGEIKINDLVHLLTA